MMTTDENPGFLRFEKGILSYQSTAYGSWSLPVSDISLIAEYTNEDGPFVDDYFFVFQKECGEEKEASFYAEGRDQVLGELKKVFPGMTGPGLCNSTSNKSRILWPEKLIGFSIPVGTSENEG